MVSEKKLTNKIKGYIWLIIIVSIIMGQLGVKVWIQNVVIKFIMGLIVGAITGFITDSLLENLDLEFLKDYICSKEIFGFEFSISVFLIVSGIVELIIFV